MWHSNILIYIQLFTYKCYICTVRSRYVGKKGAIAAHTVPLYRSPFESRRGVLRVFGTTLLLLTSRTEVIDGVKCESQVVKAGRFEGLAIMGGWAELPVRGMKCGEHVFAVPAAS